MSSNQSQDYSVLGGWLLVWYYGLFAGGVLTLVFVGLPALLAVLGSFAIGIFYAVGTIVSIASSCLAALLDIRAAKLLKERDPKFFDMLVNAQVITVGGGVVASFLQMLSRGRFFSFISSTLSSALGLVVGISLTVMYLSKSVRVNTYFGGRPVRDSAYWSLISMLPDFIISE
ncbi:MAG: hypothetical protein FWG10_12850 [Eubacteriaceae bacterium]|nr:hypothetical protein [Eubacteriaceae bacterium]